MLLRCLLLLVLAALMLHPGPAAASKKPTAPSRFNAVNALNPYRMWTFRQSQCDEGVFTEDVAGTLNMTRDAAFTTCPSRTVSGNVFANAAVGVKNIDYLQGDVIKTGFFNGAFDEMHNSVTKNSMSIVFWLSKTNATLASSYLLEIGPLDFTDSAVGTLPTSNKLQVKFSPGSTLQLLFVDSTDVTATCAFTDFDDTGALFNSLAGDNGQFFIALTLRPGNFKAYIGKNGAISSCTFTSMFVHSKFMLKAGSVDSLLRLGSTKTATSTTRSFIADYHLLAFFDYQLNETAVTSIFNAGLPNSVPVANSATQYFVMDEDTPLAANFASLFAAGQTVYDFDADAITGMKLVTVPDPAHGWLRSGSSNVNLVAGNVITPSTVLTFHQAQPDTFSTTNSLCLGPINDADAYASFKFQVTDGLGDGLTSCAAAQGIASSCLSPRTGTIKLCMRETNDAPEVVNGGKKRIQLAESNRSKIIEITCKDRDANTTRFGLRGVRLLNQSSPTLGYVYVQENGECENGTAEFFTTQPTALLPLNNSVANEERTLHLCYVANKTLLQQTVIGTDRIYYQCEDQTGAVAVSYVDIEVRNALLAGCGEREFADQKSCISYGKEDFPINVTLRGYDAVVAHNNNTRRLYRIDSLPPNGTLYDASKMNILYGGAYADGYRIVNANTLTALRVGDFVQANQHTGFGDLVFIGARNFFNGMCALDMDPPSNNITSKNCPGFPVGVFQDGLGHGLNGCNDNKTDGCSLTFSFSLGYDEDGSEGAQVPIFSPSLVNGSEIFVFAMNDGPTSFEGPLIITLPVKDVRYQLNSFKNETSQSSFRYVDPDGDTYRIGFLISAPPSIVSLGVLANEFENPIKGAAGRRLTFFRGIECYDRGCAEPIGGRAYISDLNRFFDQLEIFTTAVYGNETLTIKIWDPVSQPGNLETALQILESSEPVTVSIATTLKFGTGIRPGSETAAISAGIWVGVAAGILFVVMSCFACFGCILGRAKRGSRAALWVVRNVLCTEVKDNEQKKKELSNAVAGGRRSLEQAIHAEHTRLSRVLCCALFMRRVFPCCIKFNPDETAIPDEEAMMKEALEEEAKRIAARYKPKSGYVQQEAVALDIDGDGDMDVVVVAIHDDPANDESIFNWERHTEEGTGRTFYYNVKTNESTWNPPLVKVQDQQSRASLRRASVELAAKLQAQIHAQNGVPLPDNSSLAQPPSMPKPSTGGITPTPPPPKPSSAPSSAPPPGPAPAQGKLFVAAPPKQPKPKHIDVAAEGDKEEEDRLKTARA